MALKFRLLAVNPQKQGKNPENTKIEQRREVPNMIAGLCVKLRCPVRI
jgi:hypothetical protein